jgi:hypothetical protein
MSEIIIRDGQDEMRDDSPEGDSRSQRSSDSSYQGSSGFDSHNMVRNENSSEIDVKQRKSPNVSRNTDRDKSLRYWWRESNILVY